MLKKKKIQVSHCLLLNPVSARHTLQRHRLPDPHPVPLMHLSTRLAVPGCEARPTGDDILSASERRSRLGAKTKRERESVCVRESV